MSYEFKGTPGPWRANVDACGDYFVSGKNSEYVAEIGAINDEREECDARAIAAVPELIEALDDALTDLIGYQINARAAAKNDPAWEGVAEAIQPRIYKARTALAKATGEDK